MIRVTNPKKFFGIIGGILLVSLFLIWRISWGSGEIEKSGTFEVVQGDAAAVVWDGLRENGFVSRELPLKFWGWREEVATKLKAGVYQFEKGEKASEVVRRLATGDVSPAELAITYPEGFTLDQIAERTAERGIGTKQEFLEMAVPSLYVEQFPFLADIPAGRDLEGYLFPDTYRVFPDDSPKDVVIRMLGNFERRIVEAGVVAEATATGRTLDEAVIMASIIEREVISDADMALVSGVLWKRNDEGVGLDADATVRYALDKQTEPLTVQDLASESPYNTRRFRGLPPGPISNPGLRALVASVMPEESSYYYYLSAPSGETIFADTNDEHNVNKAKHLR